MDPWYKFSEIKLNELKNINSENLSYPFILKPSVGFLSFGVYPVRNKFDWENTISKIFSDVEKLNDIFPNCVVDMTSFILEEMIEGEEFAIDAYFNNQGEAVILNICFR